MTTWEKIKWFSGIILSYPVVFTATMRLVKSTARKSVRRFGYTKGGNVSRIKRGKPYTGKMVIQRHRANRAGLHNDIRIESPRSPKVAWSWATKKDIFKVRRLQLFRQPDHTIEYMDFEGEIPEGYGAGTVEKVFDSEVWIHPYKDNHLRIVTDQRTFTFSSPDRGNTWYSQWAAIPPEYWIERNKYTLNVKEEDWESPDSHVSIKYDGANYIMVVGKDQNSFISRRLSVDGTPVHQEDKIPHLKYQKIPDKYRGSMFRGELYHQGPNHRIYGDPGFLAGTLNSNPIKAILAQKRYGKIKYAVFDVIKENGKDVSNLTYREKLKYLREFVKDTDSKYIHMPVECKAKTVIGRKRFLWTVINKFNGEGIVIKHLDKPVIDDKWIKQKRRNEFVLKIVGFNEGTGRLKGRGIGTLIVRDGEGKEYIVGSGLTDQIRFDAYKNFRKYKGKTIEVKAMEITRDARLRAPVFKGFTDSEVSIVKYSDEVPLKGYATAVADNEEKAKEVFYAMKSSRGWRKK